MPWDERLEQREASYTGPNGQRFTFTYENVSESFTKKTSAFDFPDADGTYVQDLGHTGRRYPLRVIFWGSDYDIAAAAFMDVLALQGEGQLEHPMYGAVTVVPFGEVTRRDDLKTASNQAIMQVTFWETTGVVYPLTQDDPVSAISEAVTAFNEGIAGEFTEEFNRESVTGRFSLRDRYKKFLDGVKTGMQPIADTQENVRRQFNDIYDSINNSIDVFIEQPLSLAFQAQLMIQAPGRALTAIKARLNAYRNLADDIIFDTEGNSSTAPDYGTFRTDDLYASGLVMGSVVSGVNNLFTDDTNLTTRSQAIDAAEDILDQFEQVATWRDDNFQNLSGGGPVESEIDTGESYQKLQEAVALVAGYLVQVSLPWRKSNALYWIAPAP